MSKPRSEADLTADNIKLSEDAFRSKAVLSQLLTGIGDYLAGKGGGDTALAAVMHKAELHLKGRGGQC